MKTVKAPRIGVENEGRERGVSPGDDAMNGTVMPIEELLSYAQVARLLQVTERTVYNLVKGGLLVSVKVGNCVRFDPVDVHSYIQKAKEVHDAK